VNPLFLILNIESYQLYLSINLIKGQTVLAADIRLRLYQETTASMSDLRYTTFIRKKNIKLHLQNRSR
jgi:hypothetical protein